MRHCLHVAGVVAERSFRAELENRRRLVHEACADVASNSGASGNRVPPPPTPLLHTIGPPPLPPGVSPLSAHSPGDVPTSSRPQPAQGPSSLVPVCEASNLEPMQSGDLTRISGALVPPAAGTARGASPPPQRRERERDLPSRDLEMPDGNDLPERDLPSRDIGVVDTNEASWSAEHTHSPVVRRGDRCMSMPCAAALSADQEHPFEASALELTPAGDRRRSARIASAYSVSFAPQVPAPLGRYSSPSGTGHEGSPGRDGREGPRHGREGAELPCSAAPRGTRLPSPARTAAQQAAAIAQSTASLSESFDHQVHDKGSSQHSGHTHVDTTSPLLRRSTEPCRALDASTAAFSYSSGASLASGISDGLHNTGHFRSRPHVYPESFGASQTSVSLGSAAPLRASAQSAIGASNPDLRNSGPRPGMAGSMLSPHGTHSPPPPWDRRTHSPMPSSS